ncbi:MAG: hypothetical protein KatS3mg076_0541 [Candidatus Binatia bacterium]|nr:MAG: hypothetical protein KatS3mg076_0541 [Candidatus Binatia bacterium]
MARYLRGRGWSVLARNVRSRYGELDLVALDGGTLVFVEVKTRRGSPSWGLLAVGRAKQRRMVRTALRFLATHGLEEVPVRFDVVVVRREAERFRILEHVEGAFCVPSGTA